MLTSLGYNKNLFILPFDHRSSFIKGLGIDASKLGPDETEYIIGEKEIIYEAFKKSVSNGISKQEAAILVDEQFGDHILRDAISNGFTTILTIEKSGQKEFAFEYGDDFAKHIETYRPTFTKALISYNPEDEKESKIRQQKNLKLLSNYCHNNRYKLLIESLIPPTAAQLRKVNSDVKRFNNLIRPSLTVTSIRGLQDNGIEPDVWKLEGMDKTSDYEQVVHQARSGGRKNVGVVILGRGENQSVVEEWIRIGAQVDGIIGFAVGRTVFWQPLVDLKNGKITKERAVEAISNNFLHFYNIFISQKKNFC